MIAFAIAKSAIKPKTKNVKQASLLYAGILVIFVVAQLFTFSKFIVLFQTFSLPGGATFAYFASALLVTAEVFALPFLLSMKLSMAMRFLSMFMGWVVALMWIFITFWLNVSGSDVANIGFLGTVVSLLPGWWAFCVSLALAILSIWATWGMWPLIHKK